MYKIFFSVSVLILVNLSGYQVYGQSTLTIYTKGNKYGFKNNAGEIIIKPKYEQVNHFKEGFASVKYKGKWGFIDPQGKEITEFKYDPMYDGSDYANYFFKEGRAAVQAEGKWGFIDTTGKEIIPLKYSLADNFDQGQARVWLGDRPRYIDANGKTFHPKTYDHIFEYHENRAAVVEHDSLIGFIDRRGREITQVKYELWHDFKDGTAWLMYQHKWGLIDTNGTVMIPFIYNSVRDFHHGMAAVSKNDDCCEKYGYINQKGEEVIPFVYQLGYSFKNGYALVARNGKYGFIDSTGTPTTPFKYDVAGSYMVIEPAFLKGFEPMMMDGKIGYVEVATGRELTPFKYDYGQSFYGNYATIKVNGKWGRIDITGKEYFP